jgi:hypothetical protein
MQEINTVKRLLDGVKRQPVDSAILPPHAGQAFWAAQLKHRLMMTWDTLARVAHMLPPVTDGTTYNAVEVSLDLALAALEAYITQTHSAWSASVQPNIGRDMDCKLLTTDKAAGGLLTCNFTKPALEMFQEVCAYLLKCCWQMAAPSFAAEIGAWHSSSVCDKQLSVRHSGLLRSTNKFSYTASPLCCPTTIG